METNWDVSFEDEAWAQTATLTRTDADGVNNVFMPVEVHIHTPSEHTISGRNSDAEVHIVHSDDMGNLSVVGVFFDRYAGEYNNKFIESIFAAFATRD